MKKPLLFFILLVISEIAFCQCSNLVLIQPDSSGQDAEIQSYPNININDGNNVDLFTDYWFNGVDTIQTAGLIRFGLSGVPLGVNITSAHLFLYADTISAIDSVSKPMCGNNSAALYRITGPWTENGVTYSNQPPVTNAGSILLAQSSNYNQDYLNIDVLPFVQIWYNSPTSNYGMLLNLIYTLWNFNNTSMIFCSGDHPDASRRPRLEICYDTIPAPPPPNCTLLVLQPDAQHSQDAHIADVDPNLNHGDYVNLLAAHWTSGGNPIEDRGLIKFDLSSIPQGASINYARLSLYADPASTWGYSGQPTYGSNNASNLKMVTTPWAANTVTWNTQPNTTPSGEILLPQSTSTVEDYMNIDISSFAQQWVNNPSSNYGLMLEMITTAYYNSLIFCSSDHPDSTRHPKLEICYTICPNLVLQPDASTGLDAHIADVDPNLNHATYPNIIAAHWTSGGNPIEDRGILKFDLSGVPAGVTVTSALLSLYADSVSQWGYLGQPTYGTNNASYLKMITTPWALSTVTWNTQPSTTSTGEVLLPQSTNVDEDYTGIDITSFLQQWVANPNQNYGMMLEAIGTNYYNSMIFCSSDHPNASKHPKLEICYVTETSIIKNKEEQTISVSLFPNPANNYLTIVTDERLVGGIVSVFEVIGREIFSAPISATNYNLPVTDFSPGLYFIKLVKDEKEVVKRFIRQ